MGGSNREILKLEDQRDLFFFQKKISQAQIISFVRLLPWIEVDVVQGAVVYIIFSLIPYCKGQT